MYRITQSFRPGAKKVTRELLSTPYAAWSSIKVYITTGGFAETKRLEMNKKKKNTAKKKKRAGHQNN